MLFTTNRELIYDLLVDELLVELFITGGFCHLLAKLDVQQLSQLSASAG